MAPKNLVKIAMVLPLKIESAHHSQKDNATSCHQTAFVRNHDDNRITALIPDTVREVRSSTEGLATKTKVVKSHCAIAAWQSAKIQE
jgi:hypothetical protein